MYHGVLPQSVTNTDPLTQALAASKHLYQQIMQDHQNLLTDIVKKFCDEHDIPEEDRPTVEYTFYHPETGSQAIEITYKDNPEDTT